MLIQGLSFGGTKQYLYAVIAIPPVGETSTSINDVSGLVSGENSLLVYPNYFKTGDEKIVINMMKNTYGKQSVSIQTKKLN